MSSPYKVATEPEAADQGGSTEGSLVALASEYLLDCIHLFPGRWASVRRLKIDGDLLWRRDRLHRLVDRTEKRPDVEEAAGEEQEGEKCDEAASHQLRAEIGAGGVVKLSRGGVRM